MPMFIRSTLLSTALILSGGAISAQGASFTLAGGAHDTTLPVEVTADSLSIDQSSNSATFDGTARVGQGTLRLGADQIVVSYNQEGSAISSVQATGNVVFTNGVDMAESGSARYDVTSGQLVMKGNVLLVQGNTAISGNQLNLNILANTAKVTGNVKTVLTPK